jgi:TolB protein
MSLARGPVFALAAVALAGGVASSGVWASDGHPDGGPSGTIAFRRFSDAAHSGGAIFTMAPDGGRERQITHPAAGGLDDQPDWAPDGSRILFTRQSPGQDPDTGRAFWTVAADGADPRLVSPGCADAPVGCRANEQKSGPLYSPDGRLIAYGWAAGTVREDLNQIEFSEAYIMNADGSDPRPVTHFSDDRPFTGDTGPVAWSPDGRRLLISRALSAEGDPAGGAALFVVGLDGQGLRQVTPWRLRAGGRAVWSGRRIFFRTLTVDDAPGGNIYSVDVDGHDLRQLTHFPPRYQLGELTVSPDGGWIMFSRGEDDRDLFLMRADGTHQRQVTRTTLSENWPDWAPGRG